MQNNSNHAFRQTVKKSFLSQPKTRQTSVAESKSISATEHIFTNKIISSLSAEEISWFASFARKVNLSVGESVYRHGDDSRYIYFPETAIFSQSQVLEDGRTCEIALIGNEGVLGLPSSSSLEATCWTEVVVAGSGYKINREVFKRDSKNSGALQARMIDYTNQYIEQLSQKIICNYFHQIRERFCAWLLTMQDRLQQRNLAFTQEAMAQMLGVHRPSLSCVAKDLQQEKSIAYARGQIKILDREKLENQACACYSMAKKYAV